MKAERQIVSNTGPLISLEKLTDGYKFIRLLYDRIIIPPAVLHEVADKQFGKPSDYLKYYGVSDIIDVRSVSFRHRLPELNRLHEGERQAIELAIELDLPLLIEETLGREIALKSGINFSGIAGQIIKAFRQKLISMPDAQNKLGELFRTGRINRKVYENLISNI